MTRKRLGKLPPRYSFLLNPYRDVRLSKCPKCNRSTRLRKFALFIHIDGFGPMALGKTCRYCPPCDLIIAHQDELEHELTVAFESRNPDVIGNEYMVLGIVDRKAWRKGLKGEGNDVGEMLDQIADFKEELELEYEPEGWRPSGDR